MVPTGGVIIDGGGFKAITAAASATAAAMTIAKKVRTAAWEDRVEFFFGDSEPPQVR